MHYDECMLFRNIVYLQFKSNSPSMGQVSRSQCFSHGSSFSLEDCYTNTDVLTYVMWLQVQPLPGRGAAGRGGGGRGGPAAAHEGHAGLNCANGPHPS